MVTERKIKKLVNPLILRNNDVCLVKNILVINPIYHILKGVMIEKTRNPYIFTPVRSIIALFEPGITFNFSWGMHLFPPPDKEWNIYDDKIHETLVDKIETDALPLLRSVHNIEDFIGFTSSNKNFPGTILKHQVNRKIIIDIARGDLTSALNSCISMENSRESWVKSILKDDFFLIMDEIYPLLVASDHAKLAALLHKWEAESVKRLALEKFWKSTPFPLELMPPKVD